MAVQWIFSQSPGQHLHLLDSTCTGRGRGGALYQYRASPSVEAGPEHHHQPGPSEKCSVFEPPSVPHELRTGPPHVLGSAAGAECCSRSSSARERGGAGRTLLEVPAAPLPLAELR